MKPFHLLGLLLNSSQDKAAGHASRDTGTDAQTGFIFTNKALCWSCCFSARGSAAPGQGSRGTWHPTQGWRLQEQRERREGRTAFPQCRWNIVRAGTCDRDPETALQGQTPPKLCTETRAISGPSFAPSPPSCPTGHRHRPSRCPPLRHPREGGVADTFSKRPRSPPLPWDRGRWDSELAAGHPPSPSKPPPRP